MRLTERIIERLSIEPGRKDRLVFDETQGGLAVRVGPNGTNYLAQYTWRGTKHRIPLGNTTTISLAQAREAVAAIMGEVASGKDPASERRKAAEAAQAERERERLSLKVLVEEWRRLHLASRRPRYAAEAMRALTHAFPEPWHRPAEALTRGIVVRALDVLPAAMASRTAAYGRACYGWAVKRGMLAANPFANLPSIATEARDRVLDDAELAAVWRAAEAEPAPCGPLVKLLIMTGQRREEVGGMRWRELSADLATWTIPGNRTKNGEPHIVPLAEPVRVILGAIAGNYPDAVYANPAKNVGAVFTSAGGRVFNGWSKGKARLAKAAGIAPWRLHDLRRTLATGLQRLGVRLEVTEAVLNHRSGSRAGIVGVYQRHDWAAEKRAALDAWAAHVLAAAEGRDADGRVVELRRAG